MFSAAHRTAWVVVATSIGIFAALMLMSATAATAEHETASADGPTHAPAVFSGPNGTTELPVEDRLFLAFYYVWYNLGNWSSPQMLERPLEPYESSDPAAVARHVTWAQTSRLNGLLVSWWGRDAPFAYVEANWAQVLDAMIGTDL